MFNISRISINAIGKVKKKWIREGINEYKKRMPCLVINEYKNFNTYNFSYKPQNIFISLSEEGIVFNSLDFANLLSDYKNKKINFLIGGAEGLSYVIKNESDLILSLSHFTFPHELARLILIEQIYRASCIKNNSPYHRQ